jgi:hypothetical protein
MGNAGSTGKYRFAPVSIAMRYGRGIAGPLWMAM